MEWLKVIALGIVQGITEFLPISSTGHLIVAAAALDFQNSIGGTFEIFIQLGSVLAVVLFYWRDLLHQVATIRRDRGVQRLWLAIVIAAVPAALVGFVARDFIKDTLFNPTVVGVTLILGGVVFLVVDRRRSISDERVQLEQITLRQALTIGFAQLFALIPGVSRSGASIIGGLIGGLNRPTATAFSFYLAIPVLGGATVLDLVLSLDEVQGDSWGMLVLGTLVSFVVSLLAMGWLLRYVARNTFLAFGVYRILAGVGIVGLALAGALA